jgi:hypothetical protein
VTFQAGGVAKGGSQMGFADHAAPGMIGTMPGAGLCRVPAGFPLNKSLSTRHSPAAVERHSSRVKFAVRLGDDSIINFTRKKRGAPMRRPPQ